MKVFSRWIDEMPMIAVASFTLSTEAFTVESHSGWSGWPSQVHARDEGLVAADDHHDEQVGDHHHVDQREHHQHEDGLVQLREPLAPSTLTASMMCVSAAWLPNAARIR